VNKKNERNKRKWARKYRGMIGHEKENEEE
jgi:hypothetical protein